MRRILVTAAVAVTLALGSVVSPAAAQPADQANCIGEEFSGRAREDGRRFGESARRTAQEAGGVGQFLGPLASSNCRDTDIIE